MTKLVRFSGLVLVLAALLGGMLGSGGAVEAASGDGPWIGPATDGCYYNSNYLGYAAAACPRGDGGFDFYLADGYGQWVYWASTGFSSSGTGSTYYTGQTGGAFASTASDTATTFQTNGAYYHGTNPQGGLVFTSGGNLAGPWLERNCVEVVGGVCYHW
jgi:hypothetical protein